MRFDDDSAERELFTASLWSTPLPLALSRPRPRPPLAPVVVSVLGLLALAASTLAALWG